MGAAMAVCGAAGEVVCAVAAMLPQAAAVVAMLPRAAVAVVMAEVAVEAVKAGAAEAAGASFERVLSSQTPQRI